VSYVYHDRHDRSNYHGSVCRGLDLSVRGIKLIIEVIKMLMYDFINENYRLS
jgi:hypothetical protein